VAYSNPRDNIQGHVERASVLNDIMERGRIKNSRTPILQRTKDTVRVPKSKVVGGEVLPADWKVHLATNADGVSNIMNPGLFMGLPKLQDQSTGPKLVLSSQKYKESISYKPSFKALKDAVYFKNELSE
jgi:hypothetical protein